MAYGFRPSTRPRRCARSRCDLAAAGVAADHGLARLAELAGPDVALVCPRDGITTSAMRARVTGWADALDDGDDPEISVRVPRQPPARWHRCFGLREERQRLGDVIVAEQLRVISVRAGETEIRDRGDKVTAGHQLVERFRAGAEP